MLLMSCNSVCGTVAAWNTQILNPFFFKFQGVYPGLDRLADEPSNVKKPTRLSSSNCCRPAMYTYLPISRP